MYFSTDSSIPLDQLVNLYNNAGWINYTANPDKLNEAIMNSLDVLSVWENETLIGLIRTVGDGISIIYIQDILILKPFQNKGLGSQLLNKILNKYQNVMQIVLLTDNTDNTRHFYEKHGFYSNDKYHTVAYSLIRPTL